MKNLLSVLCSLAVYYAYLAEAKIINCEPPKRKVATQQEFRLDECNNADSVCHSHWGGETRDMAVINFTAPDGKLTVKSDFECKMTQYKKEDVNSIVTYYCDSGEKGSFDEDTFKYNIKPIEGGETRYIVCWCKPNEKIPQDSQGYIRAELTIYGTMEVCYFADVENIYYY